MDQNFFWGAATSSHQVEGGNHNDWSEWELAADQRGRNADSRGQETRAQKAARLARKQQWPDYILNNYPNPLQEENYISGKACDHYNRFREDFDIAKSLGHNAHRFSIEWSRVEPEEGKFDEKEIAHYREVIRALRERGLEPFVTLWHWTLPVWLAEKGGVLNRDYPKLFSRYVEKVVAAYKNDVQFWITINEPEIYAAQCYFRGVWSPQKKGPLNFFLATHAIIRAHKAAYAAIKSNNADARVGIAKDNIYFSSSRWNILGVLARKAMRWMWNYYFLERMREYQDFIGLNYYFHRHFGTHPKELRSDMGWGIYPHAFYHVLRELKPYGVPIYVTENGIADARDAHRAKFIRENIKWMKRAMNEGVDVRGYFYWSLLDNFEWDKGFWPRFGLVEVNYKTMKRTIRPSALEYKKIINSWPK